jgi:protein-glutamine gamma-glutamyltransferase
MILIKNEPFDAAPLIAEYPEGSMERKILTQMAGSQEQHRYDSAEHLKFELRLRKEIIDAANELYRSDLDFAIFRKSTCNPDYWNRTDDGGFSLKEGVKPSDAISDIFKNSSKYATECATAMLIIYYRALQNIYSEELFNRTFPAIHLMNWHRIEKNLREVGAMRPAKEYFPGDRRYFANPDVDPLTPEWQGKRHRSRNGLYYGHGIGRYDAETMIRALNENRREDADESAYLIDAAGAPTLKDWPTSIFPIPTDGISLPARGRRRPAAGADGFHRHKFPEAGKISPR